MHRSDFTPDGLEYDETTRLAHYVLDASAPGTLDALPGQFQPGDLEGLVNIYKAMKRRNLGPLAWFPERSGEASAAAFYLRKMQLGDPTTFDAFRIASTAEHEAAAEVVRSGGAADLDGIMAGMRDEIRRKAEAAARTRATDRIQAEAGGGGGAILAIGAVIGGALLIRSLRSNGGPF